MQHNKQNILESKIKGNTLFLSTHLSTHSIMRRYVICIMEPLTRIEKSEGYSYEKLQPQNRYR